MGRHLMNNTSQQSIPNILRRRKTGFMSVKTSMSRLLGGEQPAQYLNLENQYRAEITF